MGLDISSYFIASIIIRLILSILFDIITFRISYEKKGKRERERERGGSIVDRPIVFISHFLFVLKKLDEGLCKEKKLEETT